MEAAAMRLSSGLVLRLVHREVPPGLKQVSRRFGVLERTLAWEWVGLKVAGDTGEGEGW